MAYRLCRRKPAAVVDHEMVFDGGYSCQAGGKGLTDVFPQRRAVPFHGQTKGQTMSSDQFRHMLVDIR